MDTNVLIYHRHEIPMNDNQIGLLEDAELIQFARFDGHEAVYVMTVRWLQGCEAFGADPLESSLIFLDKCRADL